MTVRKVIDKLNEREIVYSVQGKGSFISPFHSYSKPEKLTDILGATKVVCLPCSSKIPKSLLRKFDENFKIDIEKIITYAKLYFIEDKIVAFTLNWLNNEDKKHTLKDVLSKNRSVFDDPDFNKIISTHKLEKTSPSDKNILLANFEYTPTIYSYFVKKNRNILLMRVSKILPKYYQSFEVKNR